RVLRLRRLGVTRVGLAGVADYGRRAATSSRDPAASLPRSRFDPAYLLFPSPDDSITAGNLRRVRLRCRRNPGRAVELHAGPDLRDDPAAGNDFLARLLHAAGGVHGAAGPERARAGAARVRPTAELLVRGGVRLSDVPDLSNHWASVRIRRRLSLGAAAGRASAGRTPRRPGSAA